MLKLTVPAMLGLMVLLSAADAETNPEAERILSENLVKAALQMMQLPEMGLAMCGSSAEYPVEFSSPTFTEQLVQASRGGSRQIIIDGFSGERAGERNDKLDYWLAKLRLAGRSVTLKDVTPNQSVATAIIAWVMQDYAKELVSFVTTAISSSVSLIYKVAADEYISAGVRRYDATIEYVRGDKDAAGHGVIQKIALNCAPQ